MTNKVIEAKANSLFAQNNYSEAFYALLTLGAEAFVDAFPRTASRAKTFLEKHLSQEPVKSFFWKEYILSELPDQYQNLWRAENSGINSSESEEEKIDIGNTSVLASEGFYFGIE